MPYPKYYATYCVLDYNPFGHSFILFSKQDSEREPIRVEDAIGYYSQPSTAINPIIIGIKNALGLDMDLQNGHGQLQQEKMRYIDGNGLRGLSFEATEVQYNALKALHQQKTQAEAAAIAELNTHLQIQGLAANGHTRFIAEKSSASLDSRPPRLRPFHVTMDLNRNGFDSTSSYTCKNSALDMLVDTGIIDAPIRSRILGGHAAHAFPRFASGLLTPLRLVTTGEPKEVIAHSGKIYYNRDWDNPFFWATSPVSIDASKPELKVNLNLYNSVSNILVRVRDAEMILRQKINEIGELSSTIATRRKSRLEEQLQRVQGLYELFRVSYENQLPNCLAQKLWRAETTLNVATLSLTPRRADYTFMLRAYESIAMRNALLGLLTLAIAVAFISTPVGAVVATTAGLFAGHQLVSFFRKDNEFMKMRADFNAFREAQRNTDKSADEAGGPQVPSSQQFSSPSRMSPPGMALA